MKLAEVLSGPETWCQWPGKADSRLCLYWAWNEVMEAEGNSFVGGNRARSAEYLRLSGLIDSPQVHHWNDVPGRTWEEVASVVEAYDRDRMLNP